MTGDLVTSIDGPVARITFNRPAARNAITQEMLAALCEFLRGIEHQHGIRCILFSGNGEHFSAGGDVVAFRQTLERSAEHRRVEFTERVLAAGELFKLLAGLPQPIVVSARGAVAGVALGVLAAADFAVGSSTALLILAHVNIGGSPDGATSYYLPRLLGARKAKELAILGQKVPAAEALALGLLNRVVPDAELDLEVAALVARICAAPAESVRRAKMLMDRSLDNSLELQLQIEALSFAACAATDDFIEGVTAFTAKRKAVFNQSI